MDNREIETNNFRARIGQIDNRITKMVKVGDIIIKVMIIRDREAMAGMDIIIIKEVSKIIIVVEDEDGIHHKIMSNKDIHTVLL